MTTLKTKSSEKKHRSCAHSLSQSSTDSEGDIGAVIMGETIILDETPPAVDHLTSNQKPSRQSKKFGGITPNLNESYITREPILVNKTASSTVGLADSQQSSRQSTKFGGITSSLNESCITGKTISLDKTASPVVGLADNEQPSPRAKKFGGITSSLNESCIIGKTIPSDKTGSPVVGSASNQQSSHQSKKFGGITSSLNASRIAGSTIQLDEMMTSAAGLTTNPKPSRKRKRVEDIESSQNDSSFVSGETVLLDETQPDPKPSKPKKRKVNEAPMTNTSIPSMLQEPVAGPSRASDPLDPPEVSNVSSDATLLLDEDAVNKGYMLHIDPTEASLLYEHLTDDEEIWMIQCPKFINPELLVGNSINLRKKSTIKCRKGDGSDLKLDSYPVTTEEGSSKINLILPSEDEFFKIKVTDLRGKLIITEQVPVPEIDYEAVMNTRKEEVAFPSNLKVRHPLLGLDIPKGPTLTAKERLKAAKKLNRTSKSISTGAEEDDIIISQDLFTDYEEERQVGRSIGSTKKNKNTSNPSSVLCSENTGEMPSVELTDMNDGLSYQTFKPKKKKKKHAEESYENYQEIKTEQLSSEPTNSSGEFYAQDSSFISTNRSYLGDSSMNQPLNIVVNPEDSFASKSKKKRKKHTETPSTVDANDLSLEFKDEVRDPLETSECDSALVTSKKKKKKHREKVSNDVEPLEPEFKQEPEDPLGVGPNDSADNLTLSKSKKKKKRHREAVINDSAILDREFKTEPRDPLDLGPEFSFDDSYSLAAKKRKKHDGIRLNDSTVLPVVCKSEWDDDQHSSFEPNDNLTPKPKKKKKKRHEAVDGYENPSLDETQYSSPVTDFNPSQNNELTNKHKKKKKRSLATSDFHEISCAEEESFDQPADRSLISLPGQSKKKKRKSGLDNNIDELTDPLFIKLEVPESVENEVESSLSIFNPALSDSLPSFLDTLSYNFEFSTPDSSKSKKKKKKSRQTVEE